MQIIILATSKVIGHFNDFRYQLGSQCAFMTRHLIALSFSGDFLHLRNHCQLMANADDERMQVLHHPQFTVGGITDEDRAIAWPCTITNERKRPNMRQVRENVHMCKQHCKLPNSDLRAAFHDVIHTLWHLMSRSGDRMERGPRSGRMYAYL